MVFTNGHVDLAVELALREDAGRCSKTLSKIHLEDLLRNGHAKRVYLPRMEDGRQIVGYRLTPKGRQELLPT